MRCAVSTYEGQVGACASLSDSKAGHQLGGKKGDCQAGIVEGRGQRGTNRKVTGYGNFHASTIAFWTQADFGNLLWLHGESVGQTSLLNGKETPLG
jgi:hypothetical protein